jgi:hypothetical protein
VKADRQEALVVVRMFLAVEIAQAANPKGPGSKIGSSFIFNGLGF